MAPWKLLFLSLIAQAFFFSHRFPPSSYILRLLVLVLAYAIISLTWRAILWPLFFSPLRNLPGPTANGVFIGQSRQIRDERAGYCMNEWINAIPNEGLICYRLLLNQERLMITSPRALSEVLIQKNYEFVKPLKLRFGLGRILGVGLIVAEGDEHKMQRKRLSPAFTHRHVRDQYPIFWSKSVELAQALPVGTTQPETLNIRHWLSRTTLDIIGVAGMGHDFHAIQNPDSEACAAYADVFDPPQQRSRVALLGSLALGMVAQVLPIKCRDTVGAASEKLKGIAHDLIRQKQKAIKADQAGKTDIISVAMQSESFGEDELANQIMTFLAAGHETTATAMTWAILALTRHPEVQTKLRAEIRHTLPGISDTSDPPAMTADLIDAVPYLHAVCNEVLRLYPPAGLTRRVAARNTTILDQVVPKGTDVVICMRTINQSRDLWGLDAAEFKPERWMGPGRAHSGGAKSNFANMTFLHGPRSCIGQAFAKGEFACMLAVLVGAFQIDLAEQQTEIQVETGLTTRPRGGLLVSMRRIAGW